MSNAKLARLENALAVLEQAVGIRTDYEVIRQRNDGGWPEPVTDAPIVVELVRFKAHAARGTDTQSVGVPNAVNDLAARDALEMQ